MKTKNDFANLKISVATFIAIFMLALNISAEKISKDFQPGKTSNTSKEFTGYENNYAKASLTEIMLQIESSIKFKGPSVQDEDESNQALTKNSPDAYSAKKDCSTIKKSNPSEEFVGFENSSAYKVLADIMVQIESTIKFKGPSFQYEEESNLALTKNISDTFSAKKNCQSANMINSSKEYIECENGNAIKALANIIELIENTIKFKVPSIQEQEENNLVLSQYDNAKVSAKFVSLESKSSISSESNNTKRDNEIKNYQELTTWLQKNLKYELTRNFETKNGRLVVYIEVDKNGALNNCSIEKTSDPAVDKIVVKLISQAPLKMRLNENGFAVKQRFEIPISYDIKL